MLKGEKQFNSLRTIILSNYDESEKEIRGLKLGAVDYIRKPIHMDLLKARVDVHAALLQAQYALERKLDEKTFSFDLIFEQAPIGIAISQRCGPEDTDDIIISQCGIKKITEGQKKNFLNTAWAGHTPG